MNVIVSGASGLVGAALVANLTSAKHRVSRLVRGKARAGQDEIPWDPAQGVLDNALLEGSDGVVHLAGENIAGRWTKAKKAAIRESRVSGTRLLAEALARMPQKPKVFVCASAIGFYGDRGNEALDEESAPGKSFLTDVCKEWEAAAEPARKAGIRVVFARLGVVLSAKGGALAKMLLPFKLCVGGVVGSGKQYWSWIDLEDVAGALRFALETESLSGPVNLVAPNPATNREFTKALGKVLGRPTIFPMPAFVARIVLGEMADGLLLASARVAPKRLLASGYAFKYPELDASLRHALGR
ncbi:MAG: TIGR01777 family protein [Planctomycetes bacterium]|nr:TIGR01777 family protein [Planctomycetota bacterium]